MLQPIKVQKMIVKIIKHTQEPEKTCACAARLCYSSVSIAELSEKITQDNAKSLLEKVILSGHYSVLEHASFTFAIEGVSRALLAQLTRHRIASFSIQSQRYVKFDKTFEYIIPPYVVKDKKLQKKFDSVVDTIKKFYDEMLMAGVAAEDARYILPQASATKIIMTMNARELLHFFSLRCCNRAQWEIREMACRMLALAKEIAPVIFKNAGPSCMRTKCAEAYPCGNPWERNK
jgi:thymidylate synthase (FAD)